MDKHILLKRAKWLVPVVFLVLIIFAARSFFSEFNIHTIRRDLTQLSVLQTLLVLLIGLVGVTPMLLYDLLLSRRLGLTIPAKQLLRSSWVANTFTNFIGFGGFTAVSLRRVFYKPYYTKDSELTSEIIKNTTFYVTGLSILSIFLTFHVLSVPTLPGGHLTGIVILIMAIYLPAIIVINIFLTKKIRRRDFGYMSVLILVSFIEWSFALLTLWGIALILGIHVALPGLAAVFAVSACAGIVSMIPGGLGSFDIVLLLGLTQLSVSSEESLILLVLFRLSYYIVPWMIGCLLFVDKYWRRWNESFNHLPNTMVRVISHKILTVLVFLAGMILLLSAALPGVTDRVQVLSHIFSTTIISLSHQLTVASGLTLLALARGIGYRVKRAYTLTLIVLILSALFVLSKGIDYEEATFMLITAVLLRFSKGRFYRERLTITWGKGIFDTAVLLIFAGLYILIGYLNLPGAHVNVPVFLKPYTLVDPIDLFTSGAVGLGLAAIAIISGFLVKRPRHFPAETSAGQEEKIKEHLDKFGGTVLAHLVFLHDKSVYWTEDGETLFIYRKFADKVVILGEPVGPKDKLVHALEEFLEKADRFGLSPLFYQVSGATLPYLHENGYDFFKLGEEAYVTLETFTLAGKKMKGLRAVKNKFDRDAYSFEVIKSPFSDQLLSELKSVSDTWLGGRKEKGFSLGFFDEGYISRTPLGLLRQQDGKLIGFVTVMPMYDGAQTASIDLMRFLSDAPNGTMDFLFICMFEWAKENGYRRFNVGMAPLANVGLSKFSFLSERIASQIYLFGHFIYHFQGLKHFKDKFADIWEGKYLAYRKKSSLPLAMLQLAVLISEKRKTEGFTKFGCSNAGRGSDNNGSRISDS